MNNDLISRSELKEAIRKRLGISSLKYLTEQEKVIVDEIDNAPTVNYPFYQEAYQTGYEEGKNARLQGEWICVTKSTFPQYQPDEYKCPFCNVIVHRKTNYCEYCGASMKGGKNG